MKLNNAESGWVKRRRARRQECQTKPKIARGDIFFDGAYADKFELR